MMEDRGCTEYKRTGGVPDPMRMINVEEESS